MQDVTVVVVKGFPYSVPTPVLALALETFDQQYKRATVTVPALARAIAHDLMPATRDDMFSEERLTRVILSIKGRNGGRKKGTRPSSPVQLNLIPGAQT